MLRWRREQPSIPVRVYCLGGVLAIFASSLLPDHLAIADEFSARVRPILERYCSECHAGDVTEADIDLGAFSTLDDFQHQSEVWIKVRRMLDSRQMPPLDADQLTDAELQLLKTWVRSFLKREAEASAGDPGPIVLRRLNNEEYNYTVRDLTGVESLNPTREFPIDGAAGEGFINTGSAQSISPSFVTKYLDAAKEVAEHVVLLPDGIRFSTYTTRRDQTDELLARIQAFYRKFTADGGGAAVDLQGIKFDTNQGGVLPLQEYLTATLEERDALAHGDKSFEAVAVERSLNAKYLSTLWKSLSTPLADRNATSLYLADIRRQWQVATREDVDQLVTSIEAAQQRLWKFNAVGQLTDGGHQKIWMEPASPIVTHQELRLALPAPTTGADSVIYLTANDLGDASEGDFVIWQQPRLEFKPNADGSTQPPILLRDVQQLVLRIDGVIATAAFGKHPNGSAIDGASLCVQAPQTLELRLPAALITGAEFVVSAELHPATSQAGSIQVQASSVEPTAFEFNPSLPILVSPDGAATSRIEAAMAEFRSLFPAALCYFRIVPVDEVVTLTLFFREDEQLRRLMLSEPQIAELDQLWDELFYVAQEPIALTVAFEQIYQFATQDRPDLVNAFEPMRQPINARGDRFRQRLIDTQPAHLDAVVALADRAWRRPLLPAEAESLRSFYSQLRSSDIAHEVAIRLTLARILASPTFLYRREQPSTGTQAAAVTSSELATRLSYFLWSSMPDDELRQLADSNQLSRDDVLVSQTRRMLEDARTRRLAIQFACQWLHLRDFDQNDDKNEKLYPEFARLRYDMYEETVLFFEDMFRNDGSVLDFIDADHTFLNASLAKHYGIEGIEGAQWQRVDQVRQHGRGGVLAMATMLASQSGASRTSPILRGNWVYETLLGQRLPRPPANVPVLPEELLGEMTERQLIELHSSAPDCAKCHVKIDHFGFALEQYDAIGRLRSVAVDTKTATEDGQEIEGIEGLRNYLLNQRHSDVVQQFCRKLLGFALGREVQLSDEPLLDTMEVKLHENNYRFHVAVETIVTSDQFCMIRGQNFASGNQSTGENQ